MAELDAVAVAEEADVAGGPLETGMFRTIHRSVLRGLVQVAVGDGLAIERDLDLAADGRDLLAVSFADRL